MNRMIIQVDADRVAYDGRDWTPVAGEHAWAIARIRFDISSPHFILLTAFLVRLL